MRGRMIGATITVQQGSRYELSRQKEQLQELEKRRVETSGGCQEVAATYVMPREESSKQ